MKQPIEATAPFIATALSILMARNGITELTFTLEEFNELNLSCGGIKMEGEFVKREDEVPESVTVTALSVVGHDLH